MTFSLKIVYFGLSLWMSFIVTLSNASSASCGETIKDLNGTISYHNETETCTWTFNLTSAAKTGIYFRIEKLVLGEGTNLTFYNGHLKNEIIRFQGTQGIVLVVSSAADTTIQLEGLNSTVSQFNITYDTNQVTGCQQRITSRAGSFQSPFSPQASLSVICRYHLSVPDVDTQLAMTFNSMILGKSRLIVYDGVNKSSPLIANFTNVKALPSDLISGGQKVYVEYHFSLASKEKEAFSAAYTSVDSKCSGNLKIEKPTALMSPGYPDNYPDNLECRVILEAPAGMRLLVTFRELQLADEFDQITIYDGGNHYGYELARFSGRTAPEMSVITTKGNKVWARFSTDEAGAAKGFTVIVEPRDYGGIFENKGVIQYNSSAPIPHHNDTVHTQNFAYLLTVQPEQQVAVNIDEDIQLVPAASINFYDGSSITDSCLATIRSSSALQKDVVASGNTMLVVVYNIYDSTISYQQHYKFSFDGVRTGLYHNSFSLSDTFELNLRYTDKEAMWFIYADPESSGVIVLSFTSSILTEEASVTIEKGFQSFSSRVAVLDSSMESLPTFYIKASEGARVTFSSGLNSSSDTLANTTVLSLTATYTTLQACQHQYTSSTGRITSPMYPNQYPLNAACKWTISPPAHKMVHLAFEKFALADEHEVNMFSQLNRTKHHGNRTVTNTTITNLGIYQGTTIPNDIVSADSQVTLEFTSKRGTRSSQGFKAAYELIDCGGNITDPTVKSVQTPGYPQSLAEKTTCAWVITVPPVSNTTNTTVNIISFKVELQHYIKENSTKNNVLEIRDGASFLSNAIQLDLQKEKSAYTTKPMLTRINSLWVRYNYNPTQEEAAVPGFAFRLDFEIHECPKAKQCGNRICMHDDWRCNGHDNCGDGSDEKDCTYKLTSQTITPLALGLSIVAVFCIGIALACLVPYLYKRCKYPGYREFRDMLTPVPT